MTTVALKTVTGAAITLDSKALDDLRSKLQGALCLPGEPGYDEARILWNAMIDRRPAIVDHGVVWLAFRREIECS